MNKIGPNILKCKSNQQKTKNTFQIKKCMFLFDMNQNG